MTEKNKLSVDAISKIHKYMLHNIDIFKHNAYFAYFRERERERERHT